MAMILLTWCDIHQLNDNPASFFVYEIWEDMESLQKHGNSTHFHDFAALLKGSMDEELDIRVYNAL